MKVDLDRLTKRFLLGESKVKPSIRAYTESILSILESLGSRSQRENRQVSIAKQHLYEIRKLNRRLEEKLNLLEEQIKILEEGK
jgi:hypothetical protein